LFIKDTLHLFPVKYASRRSHHVLEPPAYDELDDLAAVLFEHHYVAVSGTPAVSSRTTSA
jgi:hypothetical protein